jgi:hypothetical protein
MKSGSENSSLRQIFPRSTKKVVPRTALCDIFCLDRLESGSENGSLRHILSRSTKKWFRERFSATNVALASWKVVPRLVLCDKFCLDRLESGSENGSLRHIFPRSTGKWFRDQLSATNVASIDWKVVPRTALCDIFCFDCLKCGFENGSLRQILTRSTKKWFREQLSATYFASIEWKVVPRTALSDKFFLDRLKSGSETSSLRQMLSRLTKMWFRDWFSATNFSSIDWKVVSRQVLCDKF